MLKIGHDWLFYAQNSRNDCEILNTLIFAIIIRKKEYRLVITGYSVS